ncbi:MAG: hypothetical protein RSG75_04935 [Cellulosilyticaceae bacterium]
MNVYLENVLRGFIGKENYVELSDTMRSVPEFIIVDVDKDDMPELVVSFQKKNDDYIGILKRREGTWRVEEIKLDAEDEKQAIKSLIRSIECDKLTPDSIGSTLDFNMLFNKSESQFISMIDNKIYYGSIKEHDRQEQQIVPEVIDFAQGDVFGKGTPDSIYLVGHRPNEGIGGLVEEMKLLVESGLTGSTTEVQLNSVNGYYPRIIIQDFTGDRKSEVLITIYTGRVGEYIHAYIYTFENDQPKLIFNSDLFNETSTGFVEYLDNYKVRITTNSPPKQYMLDVSEKKDEYITKIYNKDGSLIRKAFGEILALSSLNSIDYDKNGIYSVEAIQRIVGDDVLDTLGLLDTYLVWDRVAGNFAPISQYVSISGEAVEPQKAP